MDVLGHLDLQAIDRFSEIIATLARPCYPGLSHQEVSAAIAVIVASKGLEAPENNSPDVFNQRIRTLGDLFSRMTPATSTRISAFLSQSNDVNTMEGMDRYFASRLVVIGLVHNLTDEETAWHLYSTRFSNSNILNKCKLEPLGSETNSQRVVATRDIALDEVITIYPADYRFLSDIPVDKRHLVVLEKIYLIGDSDKVDNPTFLGHMCRVAQSSNQQSNAVLRSFSDYFCCVVAAAHIPSGQEITLARN